MPDAGHDGREELEDGKAGEAEEGEAEAMEEGDGEAEEGGGDILAKM